MNDLYGIALKNAWLVPALPLFSFACVGLFIRPVSRRAAGIVATASIFASALMSYAVAWDYFHLFPAGSDRLAIIPWSFEWLRYEPGLSVMAGVLVDPISVLLMVVVTTVSSLVHLYSLGYMQGDAGFGRYFTYLNLFTFSMLGLIVAPNIMQMYIFWELVGVSSFLLIGFYYHSPSAVAASKKAFIVTRFADVGFLAGVLILGWVGYTEHGKVMAVIGNALAGRGDANPQPFDFLYLTHPEFLSRFATEGGSFLGVSLLTISMFLIYMGAAGKSAMFPLHIWLPDAMEGPTPVSALIHAATMVVAGVYLTARLFPAFAASAAVLVFVAYLGAFTCIFAAIIGCTQDDIKRVLAFSTLSQIGYMMFALGVAGMAHPLGYTASMFHLFTHAFFKALLFLGAGAVIHAVHTNEIWNMGGLARKMPITHATFLIATLAIAGVPPLSGFFSKDEILAAAWDSGYHVVFVVGLVVAGLTAFYMFRIYFVTFWGPCRSEQAGHAHEAPFIMWFPLVVLALLSIGAGFVPMGEFVHITAHASGPERIDPAIAVPASVVAVLGIAFAAHLYANGKGKSRAERAAACLGGAYPVIKKKFYVDEIYVFFTHRVIFHRIARPIAWFDRRVVDGAVNLSGWVTRQTGLSLSRIQTGQVQTYGVWYGAGLLLVLLIVWAELI